MLHDQNINIMNTNAMRAFKIQNNQKILGSFSNDFYGFVKLSLRTWTLNFP